MVLFAFIFQLIKIAVLASVYATVLLLAIRLFSPHSKALLHKFKFWVVSYSIIATLLLFFSFSYYGDHGLGDSAAIPIGYNKQVLEIDFGGPYIEPKFGQYGIGDYGVNGKYLCARLQDTNESGEFIIWDLVKDMVEIYDSAGYYNQLNANTGLVHPQQFYDFRKHYTEYWLGWRIWLLP